MVKGIALMLIYGVVPAISQYQIVQCVINILQLNLHHDELNIHVLIPDTVNNTRKALISSVLENIHQEASWSLIIAARNDEPTESVPPQFIHHCYIMFLWSEKPEENREEEAETNEDSEEDDEDYDDDDASIISNLENQLDILQNYDYGWNRRAKFIILLEDSSSEPNETMVKDVIELLWNTNNIVNSVIVSYGLLEENSDNENVTLNLYSWFPYESNQCAQVKDIVLVDQWKNLSFLNNTTLFPPKIPNNMLGCPLRVTTSEFHPNVFIIQNYTTEDGRVTFIFEGIDINSLIFIAEALNATLEFLPPPDNTDLTETYAQRWINIYDRLAHVTAGTLWWHQALFHMGDPTTSYFEFSIIWYIPCATPVPRMQKVFEVFQPSLWIIIFIVFFLIATLFCGLAIIISSECNIYKTIPACLCHAWAIFLGVSVPNLPRTDQLRFLFLLYVCYSLAMTVVFQAFFTTFLVEPGLGKQMDTVEDLLAADIELCRFPYYNLLSSAYSFLDPEVLKQISVHDWYQCYYSIIQNNNISTVGLDYHIEYTAATLGKTKNTNNILCTMKDVKITLSLCMYLAKGSPLLYRFNKIIRYYLEAGFGEKTKSSITWQTHLRYLKNIANNDEVYFVFTLSHFHIFFFVFFLGCVVSTITFLIEFIVHHIQTISAI